MTSKAVLSEMKKHGVQPSKMHVWKAKKKALEIEEKHYDSKLSKYVMLFRQSNPGSICKMHYH